jgi:hypothetical protein
VALRDGVAPQLAVPRPLAFQLEAQPLQAALEPQAEWEPQQQSEEQLAAELALLLVRVVQLQALPQPEALPDELVARGPRPLPSSV